MYQIKVKDIFCNPTSIKFIATFCIFIWIIEFVFALLWPLFLNPKEYKTLMFYVIRLVVLSGGLWWLFFDRKLVLKTRHLSILYLLSGLLIGLFFGYVGYKVQSILDEANINYSLRLGVDIKSVYLPIVFLSCFFSEVIFRGFLLPLLQNKYGMTAGIVISSILYAIGFLDLGLLLIFFLQSVVLSILYLKSKSLLPSTICAFTAVLINIYI